ncbi:hypothetical protein [Celeribacter halophilus]|jgi:hypothetical protein|uniref:Uncharacterized protein n=1 Tax=Celeribacter halophilus TaxID=576117 RepID=A0AAW7XP72_9RHOB|nr:hypothetical protein [Celeribacter halophilus]MBU2890698.1 hypothetical protein [Celeribacter halophilus]MDO6455551.1 hypothetical protein [Celeribacter halophilus]MDO6510137.1 hypothetical protein [Celeribacter halophilus]MDO6721755.1 hypothetical protein [Celeribacter halophilus]
MFTFLLDLVNEKGRGIHAYSAAAKAAYAKALSEPDHAAAFYFLATSAENFVDLHDRQPLSSEELEQNYKVFEAGINALEKVASDSSENRLAALNAIVKTRIDASA